MRGSQFTCENITEKIIEHNHWTKHKKAVKLAEPDYRVNGFQTVQLMAEYDKKHNISQRYKANVSEIKRNEDRERHYN